MSITELHWKTIEEFPDYLISSHGDIYCQKRDYYVSPSQTSRNRTTIKVNLTRDGKQYNRQVKNLVARAFVPQPKETWDTPILLDNVYNNVRADNIMWRPRGFAWKYAHQFDGGVHFTHLNTAVRCKETNILYSNVLQAAIDNGLLFLDIWHTTRNLGTYTWPTQQSFRVVH